MNSKKIALIFIAIGILLNLSFLIYPHLIEKTETAVPALKSFSESSDAFETEAAESLVHTDKPAAEAVLPNVNDETVTETASAVNFPIDINAATVEELAQIKGIGKTLAENIVKYRESCGYFRSADELTMVDGIGDKKLALIRDYIYIDREIFPETENKTAAQAPALPSEAYSAAVTTVPQDCNCSETSLGTVKTTVTVSVETEEDTDDEQFTEEDDELFNEDEDELLDEEDEELEELDQDEDMDFTENEKNTELLSFDDVTATEKYYPDFPLELNTASAKDLAYIYGIGEALAERIVEYARIYGFYDVNDLLKVSGIGQSKLELIRPYVYVDASGLPPRLETETETEASIYDGGGTEYTFPNDTTTVYAPEIYRVNINTAGKADFMQLPGIDEELAEKIISLRGQIGGFYVVEELSLVDGMTNSKLSAIWDYIYI